MSLRPFYQDVPDPPKLQVMEFPRLDGGLNIWELSYRIAANQSPDMENLYWIDGALGSRKGQEYLYETALDGAYYASYEKLFQGVAIVHSGTKIYSINLTTKVATILYSSVTAQGGTFFVFGSNLYYLNGAQYLQITPALAVTPVVPYIPVVAMNRLPDGTGGSLYQPENRLAAGKETWFNADGTSTVYYLPYQSIDATAVTAVVNGVAMTEGAGFTVDRTLGKVTFTVAPAKPLSTSVNGVKIKCYKADAATQNSILTCRRAIVYGGDTDLAVVVGGPSAQPNAYFWSGSNTVVDPSYFPFDYYNLAGNADEYITGFGKQQKMLVIFKQESIGKSQFTVETIDGRDYLSLDYTSINDKIGCDLPNTIQLVSNNLAFCNTKLGPHMLLDTTNYGENNVASLGRNINGTDSRDGLLHDVRAVAAVAVSSLDDGQRYWVVANGHAYLWDYTLTPYSGYEDRLSWFYFTGIDAAVWVKTTDKLFYGDATGKMVTFIAEFADFGQAIARRYHFATQALGTYEVLKDIMRAIFVVRSDTDTIMDIEYVTDYESRKDLTPIRAFSYKLVPRNLAYRILDVIRYAQVAIRYPGCFAVRHFSMILTNDIAYTDMSLVSAQVFYQYSGGDR